MSSIEKMSQEEISYQISHLSSLALKENNLDIIFGSNGSVGRGATGNYTLISRATGIHRVHIGRILSGRCNTRIMNLRAISQATGIGVEKISEYIQRKEQEKEREEEEAGA